MAAENPPEYSRWLVTATSIFLVWACLFAGVRTWAKLTRSLPWSFYDNIFTAAFVLAVVQCISVYIAVSNGFSKAEQSGSTTDVPQWTKAIFASQILYILSFGLSKCSTALFLGSLTRNKKQKLPGFVIAALCATWTVASVFAIALRGDLQRPWATVDGSNAMFQRWVGIEASGLCLEITLWFLSITLVWGLNMSVLKRLKVIGLFAVRLLLVGIVSGRLYFLSPSNNHDPMYANTLVYILTEAAMLYSLMSECMSCLKPFLQPFHSGYGLSEDYGLGSLSNPYRANYADLSNSRSQSEPEQKKDSRLVARGPPADEESSPTSRRSSQRRRKRQELENRVRMRTEYSPFSSHTTHIEAVNGRRKHSDEDDVELLNRQSAGIQQTTTISVADEKS